MYYEINEAAAKTAHDMNSFRDYRTNQTTDEYRREVARAAQIAADQTENKPEYAEELAAMLDRYAKKLADWYNESSRIEAMCPSVMISGGSNFPVRKKEQQNQRREAHNKKYQELQHTIERMNTIGTGGIKAGDANAVEKLTKKLADLEQGQELMKSINAYYRKHKTLDDCPDLNDDLKAKLNAVMSRSWRPSPVPFESFALTNNNATIKRTRERLEALSQIKATETTERATDIEGVKVVEETELMRIQIIFDGKPEPEIRDILKRNGFRWAPSHGAWQRQLTSNGKRAAKAVLEALKAD